MLDRFLEEVRDWCAQHDGIAALAVVGSYAAGTATEGSDVDLIILCEQDGLLVKNQEWLKRFGVVIEVKQKHYGKVISLHTSYESLPEIEFGISNLSWSEVPLDEGTRKVMLDGIRVLYDPHGHLKRATTYAERVGPEEKIIKRISSKDCN